jgi:hypothetical protein
MVSSVPLLCVVGTGPISVPPERPRPTVGRGFSVRQRPAAPAGPLCRRQRPEQKRHPHYSIVYRLNSARHYNYFSCVESGRFGRAKKRPFLATPGLGRALVDMERELPLAPQRLPRNNCRLRSSIVTSAAA